MPRPKNFLLLVSGQEEFTFGVKWKNVQCKVENVQCKVGKMVIVKRSLLNMILIRFIWKNGQFRI